MYKRKDTIANSEIKLDLKTHWSVFCSGHFAHTEHPQHPIQYPATALKLLSAHKGIYRNTGAFAEPHLLHNV